MPYQKNSSPLAYLRSLVVNRFLIKQLILRDISTRYRGSAVGVFWSFINPILLLAVYTFAFNIVFKVRWNSNSTSEFEFAIALFVGLMIFNFFSECINKASTLVIGHPTYVKKLLFPLETLPVVVAGSAAIQFLISFSIWVLFHVFFIGIPPFTALEFPLLLIPLVLFTTGLSLILAAIGPFFKDLPHIVGLSLTMLMFLSPIFYSLETVPERYRPIIGLNPLAHIIEQSRSVLMWGEHIDFKSYSILVIAALTTTYIGFFLFQRLRMGFADVI